MQILKFSLVVLAGVLTSGCFSTAIYDERWAEQVKVKSGDCPVIDGQYSNTGEMFYKGKDDSYHRVEVSLADRLNTWGDGEQDGDWTTHQADNRLGRTFYDPAMDSYRSIRLEFANGRLKVEGLREDGDTRSFQLVTRNRCSNSTLLLKPSWAGTETAALLFSLVDRQTLAVGRAKDGSLLIRQGDIGGLFILQWPILVGGDADWIRFPVVHAMEAPALESLSAHATTEPEP
jgi:hypothetical protein